MLLVELLERMPAKSCSISGDDVDGVDDDDSRY